MLQALAGLAAAAAAAAAERQATGLFAAPCLDLQDHVREKPENTALKSLTLKEFTGLIFEKAGRGGCRRLRDVPFMRRRRRAAAAAAMAAVCAAVAEVIAAAAWSVHQCCPHACQCY